MAATLGAREEQEEGGGAKGKGEEQEEGGGAKGGGEEQEEEEGGRSPTSPSLLLLPGGLALWRHSAKVFVRGEIPSIRAEDETQVLGFVVHLRGSSLNIGTRQRRLAWPLRKEDTHKSRSVNSFHIEGQTNMETTTYNKLNNINET